MQWTDPVFLIAASTGLAFAIAGWIMQRYPPKEINSWYGYRTPRAMRSQAHWDFAQAFSAKQLLQYGWGLLALSLIPSYLGTSNRTEMLVGIGFTLLVTFMPIIRTEQALKSKFQD